MPLLIAIDTHSRFHLATSERGGPCAFTANTLGYGVLLRWARAVAQGEPIRFAVPSMAGYGRLLAEWLQRQGMMVVWAPVQVVCS